MGNNLLSTVAASAIAIAAVCGAAAANSTAPGSTSGPGPQDSAQTATPIKHLVVIYQRERLVRPLLRDLSERGEPGRRAGASRPQPGTPTVNVSPLRTC